MIFFHVGFCGFYAMKNGVNVADTLANKITFGVLLIGGALFSVFYAIRRIVAACGKNVDRYSRKDKKKSETVIFVLALILTGAFFAAVYGLKLFEGNAMLEMLTAPCVFTLPFVLLFRFIAILAMNKKIKN